jgi:hypothetical protein
MDIIDIIIVFSIGYFVGQVVTLFKLRNEIRQVADELGIDIDNPLEGKVTLPTNTVRILRTEKHKDTLYLYDEENHNFVCQGDCLESLAKRIKEMDYAKIAGIIDGDNKVWFVNGIVYNTLDNVEV